MCLECLGPGLLELILDRSAELVAGIEKSQQREYTMAATALLDNKDQPVGIVAVACGLTIVGLVSTFAHLDLGRVALVLNPRAFRMAAANGHRSGIGWRSETPVQPAVKERVHFP